jgi:hypothetical protein
MDDGSPSASGRSGPNWSRINQWLLWLGLATAVAWLFFRHNEHLPQLAPLLIVLACPLMHLFGRHRHGRHGSHPDASARGEAEAPPPRPPGHAH